MCWHTQKAGLAYKESNPRDVVTLLKRIGVTDAFGTDYHAAKHVPMLPLKFLIDGPGHACRPLLATDQDVP